MNDRIEVVALLPCPFCGGAATVTTWEVGNFGDEEAGVICGSCGATHAEAVGYGPSADEVAAAHSRAVAAWNRRAPHYMPLGTFPGGWTFPPGSGGGGAGGPASFADRASAERLSSGEWVYYVVPDVPVYAPPKTPATPSDTPAPSAHPEDPSPLDQP